MKKRKKMSRMYEFLEESDAEKYSTFEAKMIGNVIAQLVSLVEGEPYIYKQAVHETYDVEYEYDGQKKYREDWENVFLVMSKRQESIMSYSKFGCKSFIDKSPKENIIHTLLENNQIILFNTPIQGEFTFYSYDGRKCYSKFTRFSYVKDFIDFVMQNRLKYNLEPLTEQQLLDLVKKFISQRIELLDSTEDAIQKNYLEKKASLLHEIEVLTEMKDKQIETVRTLRKLRNK